MRLAWWATLIMTGSISAAQAQQVADAAAAGSAATRVTSASSQSGAASVSPELRIAPKLTLHGHLNEDEMTSFLVADSMETDDEGKLILSGEAEVRRIDSVVKGDRIAYDRDTGDVQVTGNGMIMRDGSIVRGPELQYNVEYETGEVQDPNFWLGASGGSGQAERAQIFSRSRMRLTNMEYTGCPCPDPAWYISSPRVDLDFDENEGVARNGVLYFKGVPILASPYLSFPITDERKSGFLLPTYGGSSNSGFEISIPYYFNLAPNYDFTLTPRYLAKRGLQLGGEFRYLGHNYQGSLTGSYLANDKLSERDRWMYSLRHQHALGRGFSLMFDVNRVSDDDYFRDFSTFGLNEATTDYLPSMARLSWHPSSYWTAYLQTYTYQTLQDSTSPFHRRPAFDKVPELYVRGARYNWGGFDVASENYAIKFGMPNYKDPTHPYPYGMSRYPYEWYDGSRLSSYNSIAFPIVRAGWYVTPKAALHLSQYTTDWNGFTLDPDPLTGRIPGTPRTQSRVLPILSLDAGMTFERSTSLFGNDSIQTLEPRVYYLYVPYRDQSQIPVYDTGLATFNFSQAFDENLFSGGWDRIANANQVTWGLTTRWLDESSGFERLSLSAAQRIYFEDQKVTLPGMRPRTNTRSDFLVGATAALTDTLNVRFDAQFNPDSRDRNRMTAGFRWEPKRLAMVSASYRYERDPEQLVNPNVLYNPFYIDRSKEQVTVSGQWPLTRKVYGLGRIDYSIQEKRSTQSILGFEYKGDCCWAARVVYQRYAVSAGDTNTALFFQLELGGLGSLGTDPMGLIGRTINGYQPVTTPIPEKTTFERYE